VWHWFLGGLNVCSVLDSQIPVRSLFQTVGAAKLKAHLLKFVVWGGISKTLWFAERTQNLQKEDKMMQTMLL